MRLTLVSPILNKLVSIQGHQRPLSMICRKSVLVMLALLLWSVGAESTDIYRVKKARVAISPMEKFSYEILSLALDTTYHSPNGYKLEFETVDGDELTRQLMLSKEFSGVTDITVSATRKHWERDLLVVRIPLLKGYLGYRVGFIHQQSRQLFDDINSLDQIKKLTLGTGKEWAATAFYQFHDFTAVLATNKAALISMLMKRRIDYFPRGVNEVLGEYDVYKPSNPDLMIEPNLLIVSPLPVYFFVNPNKPKLAKRVHQGVLNLISNGTYEQVFNKHMGDVSKKLNLENRLIFKIDNPKLSQESLHNLTRFWSQDRPISSH